MGTEDENELLAYYKNSDAYFKLSDRPGLYFTSFCYIFRVCCIGLDMFWFNVINGTVAVSSHQTTDARLCFAFDYMSVSIYAFMLSLIFILVFRSESPSNLPCTRMCFLGVF